MFHTMINVGIILIAQFIRICSQNSLFFPLDAEFSLADADIITTLSMCQIIARSTYFFSRYEIPTVWNEIVLGVIA